MRISTSQIFDAGALGIQNGQSGLFKLQNQLSSGRKVLTPKDDPVAAAQALVVTQSRDVNSYIGLYASERADLKSHLQVRSSRIKKAQFIEVAVSDVSFRQSGPLETTVRFVQVYRSDTHQSRDIKELVWRTDGGQAKIIAERLVN